eukprot:1152332-Pelagomonas_calceolata.AAC.3
MRALKQTWWPPLWKHRGKFSQKQHPTTTVEDKTSMGIPMAIGQRLICNERNRCAWKGGDKNALCPGAQG